MPERKRMFRRLAIIVFLNLKAVFDSVLERSEPNSWLRRSLIWVYWEIVFVKADFYFIFNLVAGMTMEIVLSSYENSVVICTINNLSHLDSANDGALLRELQGFIQNVRTIPQECVSRFRSLRCGRTVLVQS